MTRSTTPSTGGPPAKLSSWITVCLAGIGWSTTVPYSFSGASIATVAWLLVGLALVVSDRQILSIATAGLVLGGFVAAGDGARLIAVLVGVTAAVLAWDIGNNAISIGRQLGPDASTARIEYVHATASLVAGLCIIAITYLSSLLFTGPQPLIVVVYLLLAAGLITVVLSLRDG
ncbi:DUF7519 family protein [Natronorubrum texcoconense]|uniref:Uncharacterized protein n=1 Tax=Natronorubrum texcoconense TaxID=1095776 RepID=A0A1G9DEB1_9EURY|nr:hypothetical protein [Natronorubrum texcoconense]SDK62179.1 hypothetical protein SAMN04515672_3552 [Natronorubrum texcoconense]